MNMRTLLTLLEGAMLEPSPSQPADYFIHAATQAINKTYGDIPHIRFQKTSPNSVRVVDDMQGQRTKRSWEILRVLTGLARKYDIKMNVQGAAGRRFPG